MSEKKPNNHKGRPRGAKAEGKAPPGSPMDLSLLEQIVKLMSANDLSTIEVHDGDKRVILKRGGEPVSEPAARAGPAAAAPPAAPPTAAPLPEEADLVPIKSPMVGTFYASPSPDAKPFVTTGSVVDEESEVCVIEAMKVFNSIKAECRGTIQKILVTNGQTVEFGQTLFLVKPS